MLNNVEKLTANLTPSQSNDQIKINEGLFDLAKRIKSQGKNPKPEQVLEALRFVQAFGETVEDSSPKEMKYGKQIKAIEDIFFGENKPFISEPIHPEELTAEWFNKMYPVEQTEEDSKKGLVNYRSTSMKQTGLDGNRIGSEVFFEIMKKEAEQLAQKYDLFVTESIQKPSVTTFQEKHYGSQEGLSKNLDIVESIITWCDGLPPTASRYGRFKLCIDEVNIILAKIKEMICNDWNEKKLKYRDFDVILTPALLFRQLCEVYPALTQTLGEERTSTLGLNTWQNLVVGGREGAGNINVVRDNTRNDHTGFRFTIAFKK